MDAKIVKMVNNSNWSNTNPYATGNIGIAPQAMGIVCANDNQQDQFNGFVDNYSYNNWGTKDIPLIHSRMCGDNFGNMLIIDLVPGQVATELLKNVDSGAIDLQVRFDCTDLQGQPVGNIIASNGVGVNNPGFKFQYWLKRGMEIDIDSNKNLSTIEWPASQTKSGGIVVSETFNTN